MIQFTAEREAVLRRYCAQLVKPLVRREGDFLIFNDGSTDGVRYSLPKMDERYPFSELFERPFFTEQHGAAAIPLVRAWLDEQINKRLRSQ